MRDIRLEARGDPTGTSRSSRVPDWREPSQKRADAVLVGEWWRCEQHGLTREALLVGDVWYCPADACNAQALQVHGSINDPEAVDRATSLSAWAGSKSNSSRRARAGLAPTPQMPVIQRRLLEEPAPRPVPIADDEDLDVDEGSDVAPDVDEGLDQEEETVSEGSDAVDATPPATEQEPPMPESEKVPASAVILEMLQKRAPITRKEFVAEFRVLRPDLAQSAESNISNALKRLLDKGAIERRHDGEYVLGVGAIAASPSKYPGSTAPAAASPASEPSAASPRSHHASPPMAPTVPNAPYFVAVDLSAAEFARLEAFAAAGPRGMTIAQAARLFLLAAFAQDAA